MSDLLHGWAEVTLGDIALSVKNGIFVSRPKNDPDGVPILRISSVRPLRLDLTDIRYSTASVAFLEGSDALLQEGDLLFTRYNGNPEYVGACARVPTLIDPLTYPDKLIRVRIDGRICDSRFIMLAFAAPAARDQIRGISRTTAGQIGISGGSLRRVRMPLPPLSEQRRIVATLEDHLSRLAAADQSILTGLKRALRLRQSIVDQVFNNASRASTKRLASLLAEPLRNGHSARASDTGEGIRTLTLTAVTRNEFTDLNTKHTVADPFRVKDLWLRTGDILVERANTLELVGTSALYTGPSDWAIYPDLLIRVRINKSATPEYVQLILSTTRLRSYFRQNAKGLAGSMPKIDQDVLLRAELPIPSIEEQDRAVADVHNYMDAIDRLHKELEISRRRSSQFRRLLLVEAFAGRLVPQDPADEPASVLVERVHAARAAQPRARRGRGTARYVPQEEMLL